MPSDLVCAYFAQTSGVDKLPTHSYLSVVRSEEDERDFRRDLDAHNRHTQGHGQQLRRFHGLALVACAAL